MVHDALALQKKFLAALMKVKTVVDLDILEQEYFSRKSGAITTLLKQMKELSEDERKTIGKEVHEIKMAKRSLLMRCGDIDRIGHGNAGTISIELQG